ncbi:phosphofurin acidic cluster sorting protein 1 isoform X1 [Stomoxys calcitrans]|uniref:phosphofurin acidic cluster sorting protein 1 isoform X1 n=1 Tax=Stomoxys calcitrans TaxID=35570 RepID=UPI0027E2FEBB|nr:phosphofurin acidic cluster sorting protein 1 isoform X1 [Stomoxys calcitrans]
MKMVDKSSKLDKYSANMNASTSAAAAGIGGVVGSGSGVVGIGNSGSNVTGYYYHALQQQHQQQLQQQQHQSSSSSSHQQQHHHHQNGQKPVPMKLFAAWEVDRTPPNCIPRLCSLTITRLTILTPLPGDMTSLSLAVKMQSSKRTLRSHEIPISGASFVQITSSSNATASLGVSGGGGGGSGATANASNNISGGVGNLSMMQQQGNSPISVSMMNSGQSTIGGSSGGISSGGNSHMVGTPGSIGNAGIGTATNPNGGGGGMLLGGSLPLSETELDLNFSLQYPHFIKRDGNRLVILLQRRKKYKSRTILGYKTLAEGFIRMDAVLQKSMDMTVELTASGKNGRPGTTVACLRAERVSSIPVDHDNKNNNSVLLADRVAEYSDEDEEGEFSSGEFNDELGIPGYDPKRDYNPSKHDMRKYRKLQRSEVEDVVALAGSNNPVDSDSEFEMKDKSSSRAKISRTISLQQRNFKQKIFALLKRFKASEELEGEVNRGTAALRGERDLDALFQELESLSCCEGDDSGPDIDSLSIGSTPKPSLRPFFTNSRIMLHDAAGEMVHHPTSPIHDHDRTWSVKILQKFLTSKTKGNIERRSSDKSDQLTNSSFQIENNKQKCIHLTNNNNSATTPDRICDNRNDSSGNEGNAVYTDGQTSDPQNSPPRGDKDFMRMQAHPALTPVNTSANLLASMVGQQNANNAAAAATTPSSNEKRSRLFRSSSSTPGGGKKKQTLSLSAEPRSVLETCLSPTNVEPRKMLLDQLSRIFASEDSVIPDEVTIISPPEALSGSSLVPKLTTLFANSFKPAFVPQNTAEVKAVLQALMGKIQKYCNSNAKPPTTVKILLIGGDWLQGAALRHYVELMGVRPPDWLNHLRFYIVPIGSSTIARHLSQMDQTYAAMFGSDNWYQLCERAAQTAAAVSAVNAANAAALSATALADAAAVTGNKSDIVELVNRIQRYLHAAGPCTQIPIAEAMVNYKDEDSCQIFVPFVSDVRIGCLEGPTASLDLEENYAQSSMLGLTQQQLQQQQQQSPNPSVAIPIGNSNSQISSNIATQNLTSNLQQGVVSNSGGGFVSGSPPQSGRISPPLQTPPSSASSHREGGGRMGDSFSATPQHLQGNMSSEAVELQVDYWPVIRPGEHTSSKDKSTTKGGDQGGKNSIKSTFRSLQVWRLPQNAQLGEITNGLTVSFATKEKKQKQIMRLGKKKEKDRDLEKEQCVEGVARLICSPKQSHPVPLRVYIDGTEWTGVKFFQLSSQWQTHVKNFPIALIGCTPMSCSELS